MKSKKFFTLAIAVLMAISLVTAANSAESKRTYRPVPENVTTADVVKTSIGTFNYFDGMPDDKSVKLAYDELDKQRATQVFLQNMQTVSMEGIRQGLKEYGVDGVGSLMVWSQLGDARAYIYTFNTSTVYAFGMLNLKRDGHTFVKFPPNAGPTTIDDADFRYVVDMGPTGPDKGKGGYYLILSPDYKDGEIEAIKEDVPTTGSIEVKMEVEGKLQTVYVTKSRSYSNWVIARGFLKDGKPDYSTELFSKGLNIFKYEDINKAPEMKIVEGSESQMSNIFPNDISFYSMLNNTVQREHPDFISYDRKGLNSSIGIMKGKEFNPDERMTKILTDGVNIGNAIARSINFANEDKSAYTWSDKKWRTFFIGGSDLWYKNGNPDYGFDVDARVMFFYQAVVNTPAMVLEMVGKGSQYTAAERDNKGRYFDGSKTYKLTVPANVPAKDFWSVAVYDTQTRSLLQTDQRFPSVSSKKTKFKENKDGTIDIYFSPKAPKGYEKNWIQTLPNKSWFTAFRLYGPLEPWFDGTWKLNDIELVD
jgi:hypothetical protein